jgi:ABC-type dipeptide/oligopeptide/nickel transport system ATPase subunit
MHLPDVRLLIADEIISMLEASIQVRYPQFTDQPETARTGAQQFT